MRKLNALDIAKVCHEANRAYCYSQGDDSQPRWEDAPEWQRQSAINGVEFRMKNPGAKAHDLHLNWFLEKQKEGWKYGPVKDPIKKLHPCMVEYGKLPLAQQKKDDLFGAICAALI